MSLLQLAIKAPIVAITSLSTAGAIIAAEGGIPSVSPVTDYSTPGMIIGALFAFIAAVAFVLYKVVLAPLFEVFIQNLKNAEEDKRTTMKDVKNLLVQISEYLEQQKE